MNTLEYIINKFNPEFNTNCSHCKNKRGEIHNINRTIMAQTLGELGLKHGAEIGVAEGIHAKVLLDNIPDLSLHCVDAWQHYPGYEEYENMEEVLDEALVRLRLDSIYLHKSFSMDAVKEFEDESLDFVYLDAAHDFKNVAMDISEWSKKVKPGGIVFGHDYKHHGSYMDRGRLRYPVAVKDVVDAYISAHEISPFFVLTNDIKDPTFGRDNPGWMFVRSEKDKL